MAPRPSDWPSYRLLAVAIVSEVVATSALKSADGMTRLRPSLVVAAGYLVAFYCLSLALRTIPVGVAYAIWSGCGIVALSVVGHVLFGQRVDAPTGVGLALIVAGIVIVNVSSHGAPR